MALAAYCFVKESALIVLPVFILAVLFALYRRPIRWLLWVLTGAGPVVGLVLVLPTDRAACCTLRRSM